MSFFRMPRCVDTSIKNLQRTFLLKEGVGERKTSWICWDSVCLPKDRGGLGVKDVECFNKVLVGK